MAIAVRVLSVVNVLNVAIVVHVRKDVRVQITTLKVMAHVLTEDIKRFVKIKEAGSKRNLLLFYGIPV